MRKTAVRKFLLGSSVSILVGCVSGPPPIREYTLARAAVSAAREVEAARHSPGFFHQAEELYRKAEKAYFDRDYKLAIQLFERARVSAEKAENSARLLRAKSGEVF
jgi:hypothetical protein